VGSHQSREEGQNPLSCPAAHAAGDAAQDNIKVYNLYFINFVFISFLANVIFKCFPYVCEEVSFKSSYFLRLQNEKIIPGCTWVNFMTIPVEPSKPGHHEGTCMPAHKTFLHPSAYNQAVVIPSFFESHS